MTHFALITFLLLMSCSSTLTSSNVQYNEVYDGPGDVTFHTENWIINTLETERIPEETRIGLTEQLMDKSEKTIGQRVLSANAARNSGLIPSDIPETSPKMLASLCKEPYKYLLHVKIVGSESSGGGVAYGGFNRDNAASAELSVYSIPDGVEVFHYFVRATEISGSDEDDDFDDNSGGEIIFGKSSKKIQSKALNKSLNALQKKSNLPLHSD